MGGPALAAARRPEAGTASEVDETPAHRRRPMAHPDGAPWREIPERYGPWQNACSPVPHLVARRHLGSDPDRAAGSRRRERPDLLGRINRLHDRLAHQRAAGARKDSAAQLESPAASSRSRQIIGWAAPGADGPPRCIWPASRVKRFWPSSSPGSAGQPAIRRRPGCHPGPAHRTWPAASLRPGTLQAAPRRGMWDQPTQATPRGGDPVRQTRLPPPGHRHHRRHQRLAMTTPQTRPKTRSVKKARQRVS
jgi:hypothetical protein